MKKGIIAFNIIFVSFFGSITLDANPLLYHLGYTNKDTPSISDINLKIQILKEVIELQKNYYQCTADTLLTYLDEASQEGYSNNFNTLLDLEAHETLFLPKEQCEPQEMNGQLFTLGMIERTTELIALISPLIEEETSAVQMLKNYILANVKISGVNTLQHFNPSVHLCLKSDASILDILNRFNFIFDVFYPLITGTASTDLLSKKECYFILEEYYRSFLTLMSLRLFKDKPRMIQLAKVMPESHQLFFFEQAVDFDMVKHRYQQLYLIFGDAREIAPGCEYFQSTINTMQTGLQAAYDIQPDDEPVTISPTFFEQLVSMNKIAADQQEQKGN